MAPKKHMTGEDRLQIENRLKNGESLSQIAKALGKSTSTVSREIQNRSLESDKGAVGRIMNRCVYRRDCQKRDICPQFPCSYPRHHEHCSFCKKCNSVCRCLYAGWTYAYGGIPKYHCCTNRYWCNSN